jgi:hypothetical protein
MTVLDIMLPYYGDVDLMKLTVESVINQSDDRWQLTVVDDGAEPGVPEWFASLAHPRIRYERNARNLGITANFQKCLGMVERDHMVMMGSDDIMLPHYVATVAGLLGRYGDATIIQPGVEIIGSRGERVRTLVDQGKQRIYGPRHTGTGPVVLRGEPLAVSLLRGNWLYFPSLCWRSAALAEVGFDQRLRVIQDLAAVLELLQRGATLVVDDEVCFQYRRHPVSVSSALALCGSRFIEERAFFDEVAPRLAARGWPRAAKAARWHVSSRLHAIAMLVRVARRHDRAGMRVLLSHAFGMASGRCP